VLVPVLRLPLLDFLQLQRDLPSLGLDPVEFARQRADFVLETHRGLKLLIEVDGGQHQETNQAALDTKRDKARRERAWMVWRVPTTALGDTAGLRNQLAAYLKREDGKAHWGVEQLLTTPRPRPLITCVWGATACARIQFLLLEAIREGILPWASPWEVS